MTEKELGEIERLAEEWHRHEHFSDSPPLAKRVLPLVKALREALARCDTLRGLADEKAYESGLYARRMGEAQESLRMMRAAAANFEKAWRESVEAHAETQAEVARLRDIVAVNDQRLADVWDTARRVLKGEG